MTCQLVSAIESSLRADMLTPTVKISEIVIAYLCALMHFEGFSDAGNDLMLNVRQSLRRYENARKLKTFQMGVSARTEEEKAKLIEAVCRLSQTVP